MRVALEFVLCSRKSFVVSLLPYQSRLPARGLVRTSVWVCKNGSFVQPHSWQQEAEKLECWSKSLPFSPCLLFFPRPPRLCCVCPWTAGWEAGSCRRLTVQLGLVVEAGNWVYSAMAEAFYLYKLWRWRACKYFALKGFRFLGGVFWWWRGGSGVYSRGAATLLACTPFNNLSSSEREEKMRRDSKGSKYRGGNEDKSGRKPMKDRTEWKRSTYQAS